MSAEEAISASRSNSGERVLKIAPSRLTEAVRDLVGGLQRSWIWTRQQWAQALEHLASCRAEAPEVLPGVYLLYERRIADLRAAPPPADWDGAFAALSK